MLGELELRVAGEPVPLGPPKQRTVLAALLVDAGHFVRTETIVDRVWGATPPAEARNALYAHIMRLRRILERAAGEGDQPRLDRATGGYLLRIDPDQVDWRRFCRLADRARDTASGDQQRAELLREALGLWQGPPLEGLSGGWVIGFRASCRQRYLDAVMAWAQVELRLANHDPVVATVRELAREHPLVEPLTAVLMRALHAAGRDAEALDAYANLRHHLADQLGTDPGPELQQLHQAILRQDLEAPGPERPAVATPTTRARSAAPAQLPGDVPSFVGRPTELAWLDGALADAERQPTAVVISTISGTAGVGKTTLALHWAHRVRDRFPDGQLYLDLRGFDPAGAVVSPGTALRGFLGALRVPPERIPSDLDAQTALYRSLLADRRMLIVLDNAADARQVRPLLPGTPGCLVLITSRDQLPGLIATEAARPITLDLLPPAQARELFARRVGPDRAAAEPGAVDQIVDRCACLPLALAIVAARAVTRPQVRLARLADELRTPAGGLDAFAGSDPVADIRSVFSWSYRALSAGAARLFRLLGLHPGTEVGTTAAASLAGIDAREASRLLSELAQAHLLAEPAPARFTCHDLLRTYAIELTRHHDPAADRHAAQHRLLDHYLHTARGADRLQNPDRTPIDFPPPLPGVAIDAFTDAEQARAWFAAEQPGLLAIVGQAAAAGFDAHAWQLVWAIGDFLDRCGLWQEWVEVQLVALDATRRLADQARQADTLCNLARAYARIGAHPEAEDCFLQALDAFGELGDRAGAADTHYSLGWLLGRQGRHAEALDHTERAFKLYQDTGRRAREAKALSTVGWYHALLGNPARAIEHCRQALPLLEELDDIGGQASTWDSLGYAHHHLGEHRRAAACFTRAVELYRADGTPLYEAEVLTHLGDTHAAAGDRDAARETWRQALTILDGLGHPDAEQVRDRLASRS
jgi:DNA-binding SARP family transcriptional activator/tetratricopeptide (TPR) repeat protein